MKDDTPADVREVMGRLGVGEDKARFIAAINAGRSDGDEVQLDEHGNTVPIPMMSWAPDALSLQDRVFSRLGIKPKA